MVKTKERKQQAKHKDRKSVLTLEDPEMAGLCSGFPSQPNKGLPNSGEEKKRRPGQGTCRCSMSAPWRKYPKPSCGEVAQHASTGLKQAGKKRNTHSRSIQKRKGQHTLCGVVAKLFFCRTSQSVQYPAASTASTSAAVALLARYSPYIHTK